MSCNRDTTCGGTSNASTTTTAIGPLAIASESFLFFSPVTSIVSVWLLFASPLAMKTGTWTSYDLAYVSTSDTKTPSMNT